MQNPHQKGFSSSALKATTGMGSVNSYSACQSVHCMLFVQNGDGSLNQTIGSIGYRMPKAFWKQRIHVIIRIIP